MAILFGICRKAHFQPNPVSDRMGAQEFDQQLKKPVIDPKRQTVRHALFLQKAVVPFVGRLGAEVVKFPVIGLGNRHAIIRFSWIGRRRLGQRNSAHDEISSETGLDDRRMQRLADFLF